MLWRLFFTDEEEDEMQNSQRDRKEAERKQNTNLIYAQKRLQKA